MNLLRNLNINYSKGWFFVTMQIAKNQSAFGVVAGASFRGAWDGTAKTYAMTVKAISGFLFAKVTADGAKVDATVTKDVKVVLKF